MDGLTGGRVDDNRAVGEVAVEHLERESDRPAVDCATSAEEGPERLRKADVDCVVSDYEMPGTDGTEFLETVREENPESGSVRATPAAPASSSPASTGPARRRQPSRPSGHLTAGRRFRDTESFLPRCFMHSPMETGTT